MATANDYSIWVLEYARAPNCPASVMMHLQPGARDLPYTVTVLQSATNTILVDVGYDIDPDAQRLAEVDGVTIWQHPQRILGRAGIAATDVDTVIITHAHYDHLGALAAFPNAEVFIQRREIEEWLSTFAEPSRFDWLKDGVVVDHLVAALRRLSTGQLKLLEGAANDIRPGISARPSFDCHTPGHQYVVVTGASGERWVLPGDAIYVYENIEGLDGDGTYLPIGFSTGSRTTNLRVIDEIVDTVGGETNRVVPGHDCNLWTRHRASQHDDGLWVAEVCLRPGDASRLPA